MLRMTLNSTELAVFSLGLLDYLAISNNSPLFKLKLDKISRVSIQTLLLNIKRSLSDWTNNPEGTQAN